MEAVAASGAPVDAITLDGDVVRRKGTLSGGYINNARSKINTYKQVGCHPGRGGRQVTCWVGRNSICTQ